VKSLLILFLFVLYPLTAFAEIDERKIDVYFANGIKTSEPEAIKNATLLRNSIKDTTYSGNLDTYNKQIAKVAYSYNETHSFLIDGLETFYQKFGWKYILDLLHPSHGTNLKLQVDTYK